MISFCTAVMGRAAHLRETLPRSLASADADVEFVVLDWNSADGLAGWLCDFHSSLDTRTRHTLRAFHAPGPRRWHHARAKNTAHRLARGDVLCNLDADNWITPSYLAALRSCTGRFVAHPHHGAPDGCRGRIACRTADFLDAGGYREDLTGWGVEDGDLVWRLRRLGCRPRRHSACHFGALSHGDALRTAYTQAGRVRTSHAHTRRVMLAGLARGQYRANASRPWGAEPVQAL